LCVLVIFMNKPLWLINLLKDLKREGEMPVTHTGEIMILVNVSQGGIQDAKVSVSKTIR